MIASCDNPTNFDEIESIDVEHPSKKTPTSELESEEKTHSNRKYFATYFECRGQESIFECDAFVEHEKAFYF